MMVDSISKKVRQIGKMEYDRGYEQGRKDVIRGMDFDTISKTLDKIIEELNDIKETYDGFSKC